jgi:hypothetical protein
MRHTHEATMSNDQSAAHRERPAGNSSDGPLVASINALGGIITETTERLSREVAGVSTKIDDVKGTLGQHAIGIDKIPGLKEDVEKLEVRVKVLEDAKVTALVKEATGGVKVGLMWAFAGVVGTAVVLALVGGVMALVLNRQPMPSAVVVGH